MDNWEISATESQEIPSVLKEFRRLQTAESQHPDPAERARITRETNKRLRVVSEEAGVEYGDDANFDDGLEAKYENVAKFAQTQLERCIREWSSCKNADVCFLLDGTSSMLPYIEQVRSCVNHLATYLLQRRCTGGSSTLNQIRVGAVIYRDFCDGDDRFEQIDFTSDVSLFERQCLSVEAKGGGDTCEDVFGGMKKALAMDWAANVSTRVLIHMCDAPCHGTLYHINGETDDYPDGDPNGLTAANLFDEMRNLFITYHFCKITNVTDHMIEVFAQDAGSIPVFDLSSPEKMAAVLDLAITSSLCKTMIQTSVNAKGKRQKAYSLSSHRPNWNYVKEMKCIMLEFDPPQSIEEVFSGIPLKRKLEEGARVKIAAQPFAKGTERIAYYGQLIRPGGAHANSILKESKFVYPPSTTPNEKTHEYIKYEQWLESQTIASYLAQLYMAEIRESTICTPTRLQYIVTRMLMLEMPGPRFKYYMIEPELLCASENTYSDFKKMPAKTDSFGSRGSLRRARSIVTRCKAYEAVLAIPDAFEAINVVDASEGVGGQKNVFIRFTNNADYVISENRLAHLSIDRVELAMVIAFSHWSYERTNYYLMVIDLQGAIAVNTKTGTRSLQLTDPAIHCLDFSRFGSTNHGSHGMQMYMQNHKCNEICVALGLTPMDPLEETLSDIASQTFPDTTPPRYSCPLAPPEPISISVPISRPDAFTETPLRGTADRAGFVRAKASAVLSASTSALFPNEHSTGFAAATLAPPVESRSKSVTDIAATSRAYKDKAPDSHRTSTRVPTARRKRHKRCLLQ